LIYYLIFLSFALLILAFIFIAYYALYLIRIKEKTELVKIVLLILISLGYGVVYEAFRLLTFIGLFPYLRILDIIGYYFVIFLTLLSFNLMFRILLILSRQSGNKLKHGQLIRNVFIILLIGFSGVNILTYFETSPIELGFFEFITSPILFYILLICYIPFFFYIYVKMSRLFNNVTNKRILFQVRVVVIFFGIFMVERFLDMGGGLVFPVSFLRVVVEFTFISILFSICVAFILRDPDFYDNLSSYFCVKSIYLLRKSGQMLFGYNFQEEESEINFTSDQLLIGGFIYAISNGLKMSLKLEGEVDEIDIGETTLIIEHGEKTFAILFVSEHTEKLHQKIQTFIKTFEKQFDEELTNWTGDISSFHSEKTQKIIFDIFK